MRLILTISTVAMFFMTALNASAFNIDAGSAMWGKFAINTCRACHKEMGGEKLNPTDRSAKAWDELFSNNYKRLTDLNHNFAAVGLNDRSLENIHRYLVENAADSAQVAEVKPVAPVKPVVRKPVKKPTVAVASGKDFDFDSGSAVRGKYIFKKCLRCHAKQDIDLSPSDNTKKAWSRFFKSGYRKFKRKMPEFGTGEYAFTTKQMQDLHQFLRKYALDAAKPRTCE